MIELRWLDAPLFVSPDEGVQARIPRQKILQYRVRTNMLELGLQPTHWSVWLDVPTVLYEYLPSAAKE